MAKEVSVELNITVKEAQDNLDKINKKIQEQEDLINDVQREIEKLEDLRGKTNKKDQNRINQYNEKIEKSNKLLKRTKTRIQENKQERTKANKVLKDATKNNADFSGVLGLVDRQTGGLISSTQNFTGTLGAATKGASLLRIAMLAIPFVGIITAITAVATAFTSSEEGQNKFRKFFTQIKVVIGNVTDILSDFGMAIIKVFTGDFKGAADSINEVTEGIKNFGEETEKEIKKAGQLADARAKADLLERQLQIDRAEATRKFNELREIAADKENVSIEDRIAALKEAGRIEEEITLKEIEAAKLRADAKTLENSLSKSTKADLDEEASLRAKVIELEASRLKKQKTLTAEITTNLREAKSERKAQEAQDEAERKATEAEELADAKKLADLKKQIREATAVDQEEKRQLELVKIDEHFQNLIQQAKDQDLATNELEDSLREAKLAKQAEFDAQDEEKRKALADKKIADEQKVLQAEEKIEEEKRSIQEQTFNNAVRLAGADSRLGKAILVAKTILSAKENFLRIKDSVLNAQKAATDATVDGTKASSNAASGLSETLKLGFPKAIPFLIAYAAQAIGVISAVKSAVGKTKQVAASVGGGAGGGGGVSLDAPSVPVSQPPAFNIVGASGENQLAGAIASQTQTPIKTFVVASDVTTGQALERNTIQGATLG